MSYVQKLADLKKKQKMDYELFDRLMKRATLLSPECEFSIAETFIKEASPLSVFQKEKLFSVIKQKTGFPLGAIRSFSAAEEEHPDHVGLARQVIDEIGEDNIICTEEGSFIWNGTGVWQLQKNRELKKIVQTHLKSIEGFTSRSLVDNVADVLKTEAYIGHQEWNKPKEIINFKNGELHLTEGEWVLKPHDKRNFLTSQIPHSYDKTAQAPRFGLFLNEIFSYDEDGKSKAQLVNELIGYTFMSHSKYEKFALLVGKGANGKSVLLSLIQGILGAANVSAVQPAQFSNKFQRAHLHMKLANLVTEMAERCEIADAELKSIVSGETTTVEKKHQDPIEITPYATCWFGTNHLPHTRDFSDALFRRAAVIHFNRRFSEGVDADPNLKDKLFKEIPGIINTALNAYIGVVARNGFTEPESCKTAKSEWRLEADQVAQFIDENCTKDRKAQTASKDLYSHYQSWASSAGIYKKVTHKSFSQRLDKLGFELVKGTGGMRMVSGVRLKTDADEMLACLS